MKQVNQNREPYEVLGLSRGASDAEVKARYRELVKQYHPDSYNDSPLEDVAKEKMQEINWAYDEIQRERAENKTYNGNGTYYQNYSGQGPVELDPIYKEIRVDINQRRFLDAERKLFSVDPSMRVAEWHYLISLVLMSRSNTQDAMRELEIATTLEPGNEEYQKAKQMFNGQANAYGNTYYGSANTSSAGSYRRRNQTDEACDCCANLLCLDCICECLGGDLIACC